MDAWLWWPVRLPLLFFISTYAADVSYRYHPRLETQDGHLFIIGSQGHNITFVTSGGAVNFNGENLVHLVSVARKAAIVVETFRTTVVESFDERLRSLSEKVDGPSGLRQIVTLLQSGRLNQSEFSGGSPPTKYYSRVRDLRIRVRRLERSVNVLKNLFKVDECASNPCQNGGTCSDLYGGFHCHCPETWEGPLCTIDVNECARFRGSEFGCQNNAPCINKPGSYDCQCLPGWFGIHCTISQYQCTASNSHELCGQGTCITQAGNGRGFVCICEPGWETDESGACKKDIDECSKLHGVCSQDPPVRCHNVPGSFYCEHCPAGYSGSGHYCSDVNECQVNNGGCSTTPYVQCINTQGSRSCGPCPPGYQGDGITCSYAGGACHVNNGGCHPMARCTQLPGMSSSYVQCTCPDLYLGNGIGPDGCSYTGLVLHVCSPNPCKNGGVCQPGFNNTFYCQCPLLYYGETCETMNDPCNPNPCKNGGTCSAITNQTPRFRFDISPERYHTCACLPAFKGYDCETQSQGCIGVTVVKGTIMYPTPGGSKTYEGGLRCLWLIHTANKSEVINIVFTKFNLEMSTQCQSDYLEIYDGQVPNGYVVGRYCGSTIPAPFQSVHNRLVITFHSDESVNGDGFSLNFTTVKPECGWSRSGVYTNGIISSPGSPGNYPPNRHCLYYLSAMLGKRLQLTFYSLNIEDSANCTKDYLKLLDGNEIPLETFCGSMANPPSPIVSHTEDLVIEFHSDAEGTASGFQIAYTVLPGTPGCGGILTGSTGEIMSPAHPFEKNEYARNLRCEWLIQMPKNQKIRMTFTKFSLEDSGNCIFDNVEVRDGGDTMSPLLGKWCGTNMPPRLETSGNLATVVFFSDTSFGAEGFHMSYEILCGGVFTEPRGVISSPLYPQNYMTRHKCVYLISQPPGKAIQLQFLDFDVENFDFVDNCFADSVKVFDGDTANSTLFGTYCNSAPQLLTSTHNYMRIEFTSDFSISGRGFLANYSTIDIRCGGILKDMTGIIRTPSNSDDQATYMHNLDCTWVIVAPEGYIIQLSWTLFSLEHNVRCIHDYIEIFDNSTTPGMGGTLGRFCGKVQPPQMTSSDNIMTIRFVSDYSVSQAGFIANYMMQDANTTCGGQYFTNTGVIKSPNYPGPYPHHRQCTWLIQTRTGQQIRLNVEHFKVERHGQCSFDYVEIRNGGYEHSPLIGKFCGTSIPPEILSLSNQLFLKFSSDQSGFDSGFKFTWDGSITGCGGKLQGSSGSIMSPNYPQPYGKNAECFYQITVSMGSQIQLTIVDLSLETSRYCLMDYLMIYDGPDSKSPMVGRYCNTNHPPSIISAKNQLYIKFRSDVSMEYRGFHLTYKIVCNTTVASGFRGVIESPNFPYSYEGNMNCLWQIQAPEGNNVSLTFSHFKLEGTPWRRRGNINRTCSFDYVLITEGASEENSDSTILGRYCGQNIPGRITSSGNIVNLQFVTDMFEHQKGFRMEWAVSGCGGILSDSTYGSIQSPGYPNPYSHATICEWYISVPQGKGIQINITDFSLEQTHSCWADNLEIFGGPDDKSPSLFKLCSHQPTPVIQTTSSNYLFVRFKSDGSYSGKGFYAKYKAVTAKCGGLLTASAGSLHSRNHPANYESNDDCIWQIQTQPGHLINLTFTQFNTEERRNCTSDAVLVYDGPSINDPVLMKHCGNKQPSPASVLSTGNNLIVRHRNNATKTHAGFAATYFMACGANLDATDDRQFITFSTVVHDESHSESNCTWLLSADSPEKRITLTFANLDISQYDMENETCGASLNIYEGEDENENPITICGTKIPAPIISTGSKLLLKFIRIHHSAGYTSRFRLSYSSLATECGGNYSAEHGTIMSRDYPGIQAPNTECVWFIRGSPGVNVQLELHIPSSGLSVGSVDEDCGEDYIEIRENSPSGKLLGLFCNEKPPFPVAANNLWVKFEMGDSNLTAGHTLHFTGEFHLSHLNELTGNSGQVSSPLYPNFYLKHDTFEWRITVEFGRVIKLIFKEFNMDLYYEEGGHYSYLEVFDGFDNTAPSLLKHKGASVPDPVISNTNIIFLKFVNYEYVLFGSLFLVEWTEVIISPSETSTPSVPGCGGNIFVDLEGTHNMSAYFTSPGFPNGYAEVLKCIWIIQTSPGYHVELQFVQIDLEVTDDCFSDFVDVFTEEHGTHEMIKLERLCHKRSAYKEIIGTRRMKVVFETDYYFNKTGFSALAAAHCGGELTSPRGIISTLDMKNNQEAFSENVCEWNVTVRQGRTIEVTFLALDIPSMDAAHTQHSCASNYILLKNGLHPSSPNLGDGKYCGNNRSLPVVPNTSSNHLRIYYKAKELFHAKGFKLQYREISLNCGDQEINLSASLPDAQIFTPNYPNTPNPHTECFWIISAPPGQSIHIDFEEKLTSPNADCIHEYVELRDGGTELSHLIGRYCSSTPSFKITKGNMLWVKFFTDVEAAMDGFMIKLSLNKCGGTYYSPQFGLIDSPDFPEDYPQNTVCDWRLVAPSTHTFSMTFLKFNLYMGLNHECNASIDDAVQIRWPSLDVTDGNASVADASEKQMFVKDMCGRSIPPKTTSPGNEVFIRFQSYTRPARTYLRDSIPRAVSEAPSRFGRLLRRPGLNRSVQSVDPNLRRFRLLAPVLNSKLGFRIEFNHSISTCGGTLQASQGVISSPNYPKPSGTDYHYCVWKIIVPRGRRVTLKLLDFDLDNSQQDKLNRLWRRQRLMLFHNLDYLYRIAALVGTQPVGKIIESTSNKMLINYATIHRTAHRGFKAEFSSEHHALCGGIITAPSGILNSPANLNSTSFYCDWDVYRNGTNGTMQFTLTGTVGTNKVGDCAYISSSKLTFSTDEDIIGTYCSTYETPIIIRSPFSMTKIKGGKTMQYFAHSLLTTANIDYRIDYNEMPCGQLITGPAQIVGPTVQPAVSVIGCVWQVVFPPDQTIKVQFEEMKLDIDCSKEYIALYNGPFPTSPLIEKYCGNNIPNALTTQTNKLWIEFHSDRKNERNNFRINVEPNSAGCGGIQHGASGEFGSQGFPSSYMPNTECEWEIRVQPGYHVVLKFVERFYIEKSPNCVNDYVQIYMWKGADWSLDKQLCGRDEINKEFVSQSTRMKVIFHTNEEINGDGFKATWKVACGGKLTESSGIIVSPNFPNKYEGDLDCEYEISAPGRVITGVFTSFDVEKGVDCEFDSVTIWKPLTGNHEVFCGNIPPPPIRQQHSIRLTFKTDRWTQRFGFAFKYDVEECGGVITEPTILETPGHSLSEYLPDLKCNWTVIAPENKIVVLKFRSLDLEPSFNCRFDSFSAWDSSVENKTTLLGKFCGNYTKSPPVVRSSGHTMTMRFESDSTNNRKGFTALVTYSYGPTVGCGGLKYLNADTPSTIITALDIDNNGNYEAMLDCTWEIKTLPSHILQVKIEALQLEYCKGCSCDYLEIHDGMSTKNNLIGRFCNLTQTYQIITSSNNFLRLRFVSDEANNTGVGFRLNITQITSECGEGVYTALATPQVITSPGYPASCKPGQRCFWTLTSNSESIKMELLDMDIEPSADCVGDSLTIDNKIYRGDTPRLHDYLQELTSRSFGGTGTMANGWKLCGRNNTPVAYSTPYHDIYISFTCAAQRPPDSKGSRFKLQFSSLNCSRDYINAPYGRIYHEGDARDCSILITAPNENDTISLYITLINFLGSECETSKVAVYDGSNKDAKLLSTFCGFYMPNSVMSTGPSLYLHVNINSFTNIYGHDSHMNIKPKMDFTFTTTDKGRGCGGKLFDYSGTFSSPFYGTNYRNNSDCEWDVSVPGGNTKIVLSFYVFNLGSKSTCATNYIEIFDVDRELGESFSRVKFCGGDEPSHYTGETGHVIVRYKSTVHNTGLGWLLKFEYEPKVEQDMSP